MLLVHAHPDDESLWTGGTIARYAAAGAHVHLVTCTLGERGEIMQPELAGLAAASGSLLAGYRLAELQRATATLGVHRQHFLGGLGAWRDSGMLDCRQNAPVDGSGRQALIDGELDVQTTQLAHLIREIRPDVVICDDADGGYGHRDHVRAHQITAAAVAAEPVPRTLHSVIPAESLRVRWQRWRGDPAYRGLPFSVPDAQQPAGVGQDRVALELDVGQALADKAAAIACHATQAVVWQAAEAAEPVFALTNGIAQPLTGQEWFEYAAGTPLPAGATGIFDGLEVDAS